MLLLAWWLNWLWTISAGYKYAFSFYLCMQVKDRWSLFASKWQLHLKLKLKPSSLGKLHLYFKNCVVLYSALGYILRNYTLLLCMKHCINDHLWFSHYVAWKLKRISLPELNCYEEKMYNYGWITTIPCKP